MAETQGALTFMMISGGMQWVSSSYSRARTSNSLEEEQVVIENLKPHSLIISLKKQNVKPLRILLADDGVRRLPQVDLPVCLWDFLISGERIPED